MNVPVAASRPNIMDHKEELRAVIQELSAAQREYDLLAYDEEDAHELGPPCSSYQISTLESVLSKQLPPSYRAFLELHNGWSDFDGQAKILGVEDHAEQWVLDRIGEIEKLFFDDSESPFSRGCLPVLLGKHEDNYVVLDPSFVRPDGEMDFVAFYYGEEEERFEDLTSFLREDLRLTLEMIRDEKEGVDDDSEEEEEE